MQPHNLYLHSPDNQGRELFLFCFALSNQLQVTICPAMSFSLNVEASVAVATCELCFWKMCQLTVGHDFSVNRLTTTCAAVSVSFTLVHHFPGHFLLLFFIDEQIAEQIVDAVDDFRGLDQTASAQCRDRKTKSCVCSFLRPFVSYTD